jgi:hypothetical protein
MTKNHKKKLNEIRNMRKPPRLVKAERNLSHEQMAGGGGQGAEF